VECRRVGQFPCRGANASSLPGLASGRPYRSAPRRARRVEVGRPGCSPMPKEGASTRSANPGQLPEQAWPGRRVPHPVRQRTQLLPTGWLPPVGPIATPSSELCSESTTGRNPSEPGQATPL
jgi:hypothetical protein